MKVYNDIDSNLNQLSSDRFGLNNVYCCDGDDHTEKYFFDNLVDYVTSNSFSDYSPEGISAYFTFRYPINTLTMFQGIKRLDTSCKINLENNKIQADRYWNPTYGWNSVDEIEAINTIKILLIQSIKKIVQNKQIIGITLSGGLDSSLIVALCRHLYPKRKIYTYSCGFYGDDEFEFSREVAKLFSDKHEEIVLGKEDFIGPDSIVPSLIKHKGAPLHPNEAALAYAEEKAKKDLCDIVLCGEGADDIFGGYGHNLRMYSKYHEDDEDYLSFILNNYRYFSESERKSICHPKYCVLIENNIQLFEEKASPNDIKNKMLYFIQRLHTRGLIERGMNALSYNGFNPGFPFIDDKLVDYVNSLPFNMKIHLRQPISDDDISNLSYVEISNKYDITKYILKKVAEDYLPLNIIYREKKGFPVPFDSWFKEDKTWDLDESVFCTKDISSLLRWKKFMIINLNIFVKIFNQYKIQ